MEEKDKCHASSKRNIAKKEGEKSKNLAVAVVGAVIKVLMVCFGARWNVRAICLRGGAPFTSDPCGALGNEPWRKPTPRPLSEFAG